MLHLNAEQKAVILAGGAIAIGLAVFYRKNGKIETAEGVEVIPYDEGETIQEPSILENAGNLFNQIWTDDQPRGIRNNNPLNIEYNAANNWVGQVGSDGRFIIFDSMENGVRAAVVLLLNYRERYGIDTIQGIINRWAPSHENPVNNYVEFVASRLDMWPDDHLQTRDYLPLVGAMAEFENGQKINTNSLKDGVLLAFDAKGISQGVLYV